MLRHLSVSNYAIIDQVEIDFETGFNVITGETGAGKSILLGALSLILGERAEQKSFFDPNKKCVIEGWFKVEQKPIIAELLLAEDVDIWEECCIRREISPDGKSRSFINDCPVKLTLLKQVGDELIDVHSQHQTLLLKQHSFQVQLLDGYANNIHLLKSYSPLYSKYKQCQQKLFQLETDAEEADKNFKYNAFLFEELSAAKLNNPQELEDLEAELFELENAEHTILKVNKALFLLDEHEQSIFAQLKEIVQEFQAFKQFSVQFQTLYRRADSNFVEIKDFQNELARLKDTLFVDEERLMLVKDRVNFIQQLLQKHRVSSITELLAIQIELDNFLANNASASDQIQNLKTQIKELEEKLSELSVLLTASRKTASTELCEKCELYLKDLGMPHAKLKIIIEADVTYNPYGNDKVQFLFSANAGHAPKAIENTASGGELSRLMFVLKGLAANYTALPSIIFDEIDTGISGEVAKQMGSMMQLFSQKLQVIAISHLPQIAAKGKKHFFVYKHIEADISRTKIKTLEGNSRIEHIAQMISGNTVSDAGIQSAKELLEL